MRGITDRVLTDRGDSGGFQKRSRLFYVKKEECRCELVL